MNPWEVGAGVPPPPRALSPTDGVTRARLSQVASLLLLSPEIQAQVLAGETQATVRSLRRALAEPVWDRQPALIKSKSRRKPA